MRNTNKDKIQRAATLELKPSHITKGDIFDDLGFSPADGRPKPPISTPWVRLLRFCLRVLSSGRNERKHHEHKF
jgi:hypothetical protein